MISANVWFWVEMAQHEQSAFQSLKIARGKQKKPRRSLMLTESAEWLATQ